MIIAIISAAGTGTRLGTSIPKQFIEIDGEPIYIQTIRKFMRDDIDRILLMISEEFIDIVTSQLKQYFPIPYNKNKILIEIGGNTAEETRFKALQYLDSLHYKGYVIFHDSVRPNVSRELISTVIDSMNHSDNVIPYIICKDSMIDVDNNIIPTTNTKRLQTPQGFDFNTIFDCYKNTDQWMGSPALTFSQFGNELYFITGDEANFKITTIDDIDLYKKLIR